MNSNALHLLLEIEHVICCIGFAFATFVTKIHLAFVVQFLFFHPWSFNDLSFSKTCCLMCSDLNFNHWSQFDLLILNVCAFHVYLYFIESLKYLFLRLLLSQLLRSNLLSLKDLWFQFIAVSVVHLWPSLHVVVAMCPVWNCLLRCIAKAFANLIPNVDFILGGIFLE